eukprot:9486301-Pyramimonas_sp.AAC.1
MMGGTCHFAICVRPLIGISLDVVGSIDRWGLLEYLDVSGRAWSYSVGTSFKRLGAYWGISGAWGGRIVERKARPMVCMPCGCPLACFDTRVGALFGQSRGVFGSLLLKGGGTGDQSCKWAVLSRSWGHVGPFGARRRPCEKLKHP